MSTLIRDLELYTNIYNFPYEYDSTTYIDSSLDEIYSDKLDNFPPDFEFDKIFNSENLNESRLAIFNLENKIQKLMIKLIDIRNKHELNTKILLNRKRKRDNDTFHNGLEKETSKLKREGKKLLSNIKILKERQNILQSTLSMLLAQVFWPDNPKKIIKQNKKDDTFLNKLAKEIIEIKDKKSQHFKLLDKTFEVLLNEYKRNV